MLPGKYNITIHRGSTWSIGVENKNAAGNPTDFAVSYMNGGGKIRMQIRPAWNKQATPTGPPLIELSTDNGRIVVSTTMLTLTLTAAETAGLNFNSGEYELEAITGDAIPVVDPILNGTVTVTRNRAT